MDKEVSVVGKNIEMDGVSGKWLDVLLVVKVGETLECEARHDGGDRLTFPGELLRKVTPYDPKDYPVLPEGFRGFNGAVAGKIVKKDPETFDLQLSDRGTGLYDARIPPASSACLRCSSHPWLGCFSKSP